MKKNLKPLYLLLICITLIFSTNLNTLAISLKFNTSKEIGEFSYNGSTYGIKKIHSIPKTDKTYYCLEINNDYPNDHSFDVAVKSNDKVATLLFYGYPNISPASLGVKSDNDAYVATQIALWSLVENFDVSKIKTPKKEISNAITAILHNVENGESSDALYELYYTNSNGIQDLVSFRPNEPGFEITPPPTTDEVTPQTDKTPLIPSTNESKKPISELG